MNTKTKMFSVELFCQPELGEIETHQDCISEDLAIWLAQPSDVSQKFLPLLTTDYVRVFNEIAAYPGKKIREYHAFVAGDKIFMSVLDQMSVGYDDPDKGLIFENSHLFASQYTISLREGRQLIEVSKSVDDLECDAIHPTKLHNVSGLASVLRLNLVSKIMRRLNEDQQTKDWVNQLIKEHANKE